MTDIRTVTPNKTMTVTLHWKDGRVTEYTAFAHEVNYEDGTLKIWGWQNVDHPPFRIPLEYHDRPYGLFAIFKLARMEWRRDD